MIGKLFGFSLVLLVFIMLYSCQREDKKSFDETLLIGKWVEGTEYYKYEANHTGGYWDISDGYYEEDALPFTWLLERSKLSLIHIGSVDGGGGIAAPENFTVTELTRATLKVIDDLDNRRRTFTKVIP